MHTELIAIEDKYNEMDSMLHPQDQSRQEDNYESNGLDQEIIPHPSYGSRYMNDKNRLKLNIMDLEVDSQTSHEEEEDEIAKHSRHLAKESGKILDLYIFRNAEKPEK